MSRGFGSTFGAGTSDVVITRYSTGISTQISFSVWVWTNGNGGSGLGRVFDQQNVSTAGNGLALAVASASANLEFQATFSTTTPNFSFTQPASGQWNNIVITYDGTSTSNLPTVYVNGLSVSVTATTAPAGTLTTLSTNYYIGNRQTANRNWDGMIAHFAVWNGILLSAGDALSLASGASPLMVRPDSLGTYLPLDGINKPEVEFLNGVSSSITGTLRGTSEPPVQILPRVKNLFDYQTNSPGGATFMPAWAVPSNFTEGGYAT